MARVLAYGLPRNEVNLVTPASATTQAELVSCICSGMVLAAHARSYAMAIQAGQSLVSVRAPGGLGNTYIALLQSCNPVGGGLGERRDDGQ